MESNHQATDLQSALLPLHHTLVSPKLTRRAYRRIVGSVGNDPTCIGLQPIANPSQLRTVAKAVGIEPTLRGLESLVLPLHQADTLLLRTP